jgi:hypothetical protein
MRIGFSFAGWRLSLEFEALVFMTMHASDAGTIAAFEKAVAEVAGIVQAQRLFGDRTICSGSSPRTCRACSG